MTARGGTGTVTIIAIVASGRTDIVIITHMGRMLVAGRRIAPLVKEFSAGMTGNAWLRAGAE